LMNVEIIGNLFHRQNTLRHGFVPPDLFLTLSYRCDYVLTRVQPRSKRNADLSMRIFACHCQLSSNRSANIWSIC
jgi:hypothetical protein